MGYGAKALEIMGDLIEALPPGSSVLELGEQNIEPGVPQDLVLAVARKIHFDSDLARKAASRYDRVNRLPVGELFRGSPHRYRCINLYPGEFTLVADLNVFSVAESDRGTVDLITNQGTTEHVTDQVNVFRVMHDFARPGARFFHVVPFTGYFNHGLYNYHPVFFIFLSAANSYQVLSLDLSAPWLPHTIPDLSGVGGCGEWANHTLQSGEIWCQLEKRHDNHFKLFTDFDQDVLGQLSLPSPWDEMVRGRYDLRVRS